MPVMNVSDLEGAALDWSVACAINDEQALRYGPEDFREQRRGSVDFEGNFLYRWSGNWSQGGPLIEEYLISVVENLPCSPGRSWEARSSRTAKGAGWRDYGYGSTPLIAAMRCLVAGALGPTIEIPEVLL